MPASLMVRQLALTRTKSKANLGGLGEDEVDSLRLLRLRCGKKRKGQAGQPIPGTLTQGSAAAMAASGPLTPEEYCADCAETVSEDDDESTDGSNLDLEDPRSSQSPSSSWPLSLSESGSCSQSQSEASEARAQTETPGPPGRGTELQCALTLFWHWSCRAICDAEGCADPCWRPVCHPFKFKRHLTHRCVLHAESQV